MRYQKMVKTPDNWEKISLGEIANIQTGKGIPTKQRMTSGKYEIIGANGIIGYTDSYLLDGEYILTGRVGTIGEITYKTGKFHPSDNVLCISTQNSITTHFLSYYLRILNLKALNCGSTQPLVTQSQFKSLDICLPPLPIQKAIVSILSVIDSKIELNNQINHNLYQINDKLFNEYFGKYYDGELPNDWKLCKLTDYANINNGYSYTGKELVDDSEIGMVTIKNFERNGGFKLGGFKPISPLKNVEKFILNKSDIVVACTDLTQNADIVGNTELIINTGGFDKIIYSMDVVEIEPINIDKYYLYATLKSSVFKNFALEYVSGSTVLHLSKNCFKDFELIIPDEQKMKQFSCLIKANCDKIMNNTEMNIKLTNMRDTLLPKLMNGEINLDKVII